jgi:K+-sensing histidine kinase KdpD
MQPPDDPSPAEVPPAREPEPSRRDAEVAARRTRLLAEASRLLASASDDYDALLAELARLIVSSVADWCVIHLVRQDGSVQRIAPRYDDPDKQALADMFAGLAPPIDWAVHGGPLIDALRSGDPVLLPDVTPEWLEGTIRNDTYRQVVLEHVHPRSLMIVPLVAPSRPFGAITVVSTEASRRYVADDLALVEELASRAARAVESARLLREARTRQREAELIADLAQTLDASSSLDAVLARLIDRVRELCRADVASIAVRQPGTGVFAVQQPVGAPSGGGAEITPGVGASGQVLLTGRPFRSNDYASDPRIGEEHRAAVRAAGLVGVMSVAVRIGERIEALLFVARRSRRPFTERDERLLLRLADHAAVAVHNSRLYEAERSARADAEASERRAQFLADASRQLVSSLEFERTLSGIARLAVPRLADWCIVDVPSEDGAIRRVELAHADPAKEQAGRALLARYPVRWEARYGVPKVLRTGEAEFQPDFPHRWVDKMAVDEADREAFRSLGLRSLMIVPLVARDRVLGAITLVMAESGRRYERHDLELAQEVARRAALAIDNARLYRESEARRREAEMLARVAGTLTEGLRLSEVAQRAAGSALALLGAQSAVLRLLEPDGSLRCVATAGQMPHDFPPEHRLPPGVGLAGRAVAERRAVWSADVLTEPNVVLTEAFRRGLAEVGHHGVLAVPLRVGGEVIGTLATAHAEVRAFPESEVTLLRAFAAQAALAIRNVQLLERAEAARAEAVGASRTKDEFLAMLAHELRNPLGAVVSAVGVLERIGPSGEMATRAGAIIRRQTEQLSRLVDDLLDVARVTTGKIVLSREALDLEDTVRRCVASLRDAGRLERHRMEIDAAPVWVDADRMRLEQIIENLLTNSVKYTPPGGAILLRVRSEGREAVLEVEDTGSGIAPALLPRVFDLFTQGDSDLDRRTGGLGIGLTLVRRLVEQHGGRVEAHSEGRGRGSTFTVRLPRIEAPRRSAPEGASGGRRDAVRLRVLLVEDNRDAREMLRSLLELSGHEVHEAEDGRQALDIAMQVETDVALIDIGLPGLDGYEVARRLKEQGRPTRLVALTGYGQPGDRRRSMDAGFDAHLVKPVDLERLLRALGESPGGQA